METELTAFLGLFATHPELRRVLLNPAVPAARKRAAVAEINKNVRLHPVLGKLMLLLAERDRLVILPDLLTAFGNRLLQHRNIVRAEVTTAAPLPPAQLQ